MKDLEKLICYIENKYEEINAIWKNSEHYIPINMNMKIKEFIKDSSLLNNVFQYRNFIDYYSINIANELEDLNLNNKVKSRVKFLNSIQYKIENYYKNHENGEVPIKKCLNDLFGIRMISNDDMDFFEVKNCIETKFPYLRCIVADRDENYHALHIYFKKGKGYSFKFRWELQIWNKSHERINDSSHAKYKQAYTKWENDIKEG